jgi:hypothetical protein
MIKIFKKADMVWYEKNFNIYNKKI